MALSAANERSTHIITVSFTNDTDGASMVPDTVQWSLRDNYGNIVNARASVVAAAATTVNIVLSGADLVFEANSLSHRVVVIEATYTSAYGTGLPLKDQAGFDLVDIVGV